MKTTSLGSNLVYFGQSVNHFRRGGRSDRNAKTSPKHRSVGIGDFRHD